MSLKGEKIDLKSVVDIDPTKSTLWKIGSIIDEQVNNGSLQAVHNGGYCDVGDDNTILQDEPNTLKSLKKEFYNAERAKQLK